MALIDSFEKSGNFLFKFRGQVPIVIVLFAIPVVFFMPLSTQMLLLSENSSIYITIIALFSILISAIGVFIRAYTIGTTPHGTSGRNRDKQLAKQLNTKGIYSIVRHPLYLGNYLMWAGVLLFTIDFSLFIIISLVYWLYYERIMFAEERYLERQFGESYREWSLTVPAFIPRCQQFEKSEIPFSFKSVLRREYSGTFALVLGFTIVDYVRMLSLSYFFNIPINWFRFSFIILIVFLIIMLVLRTLKHYTTLLNPLKNRD